MGENKTNLVSRKTIIVVFIVDVALLILWALSFLKGRCLDWKVLFRELPPILRDLATLTAAFFGIVAAQRGFFNRGGTPYYTWKYGERKLKKILDGLTEKTPYAIIADTVHAMLGHDDNSQANEYFKYVFRLQKTDIDFVKVWRDYNYYDAIVEKTDKDLNYMNRLERYIYTKVYQEKIKSI